MGKFVSQSNDLWQQNLFQYRATQFPEAVGFATHTHSWLWGLATLLSSRLRNISRKEKEMLRSVKNVSSLDSVRNKDGPRLDMFYVLICIIATFYSLASCLIRFSSSHTCLQFTSPRFLCITQSATHLHLERQTVVCYNVISVTSHKHLLESRI